jgi:phosphate transport system protein
MNQVPHFQEELDQLKARLLEMGGLAEDRVRTAVHALTERDHARVDAVLTGDTPINQLHIEIDGRCVKLLGCISRWRWIFASSSPP